MTPRYRRLVNSLSPGIDLDSQEAIAAAMLLSAAKNGANLRKVLNATGVSAGVGTRIYERLRANRIWWRGTLRHSGWGDKETGEIAFWMDVCVGAGLMKRAPTQTSGDEKP